MTTTLIGGEVCKQGLASQLLSAEPRKLTRAEIDGLWRIFVAIGTVWKNTVHDSAGLKSSWLEFLSAKATIRPSYVAEYVNALEVVEELIRMYGETDAFENLFLADGNTVVKKGIAPEKPRGKPVGEDRHDMPTAQDAPTTKHDVPKTKDAVPVKLDTRLAHAKHFVVDEFIRVQIVAGGFKNFIRPHETDIRPENIVNYNGFIAGSRFNRIKPARSYEEPSK